MTLDELEQALIDRGAVMQIHRNPMSWTVLVYAPEDVEGALFTCSQSFLDRAVRGALLRWDGKAEVS